MRRLLVGVDLGETLISGGIMFVEAFGPTVYLMSDNVAYYTTIADSSVGG